MGEGAQRPFSVFVSPKRRVRAAHGRARAAKTHLLIIYLPRVLCLSFVLSYSCHSCGTLSYSLCFSNQTDQGDKTKGFEREGLEIER